MFVNYVDISKKEVVDKHNRPLGTPNDFLVKIGGAYPQLTALVLVDGTFRRKFAVVPWSSIRKIDNVVQLNVAEETLEYKKEYMIEELTSLRHGLLDQQVVDTYNRKVVRVNDIHMLKVDKDLRIAHVDVGFRALVRRLGWERYVDALVKAFKPRSKYLYREQYIAWKFVQPLDVDTKKGTIRLNVSHEDLSAIPPADLSEIIDELDPPERIALFRSFDFDTQVDVLNELEVELQRDLMEELDSQAAIRLLERMDSDEVADLLGELSKREVNRILSMMSSIKARKIYSLLKYESDSAGGMMNIEFIRLKEDMIVGEAIKQIKTLDLKTEMVYYAYVLDELDHLIGVVTFKQLLLSDKDTVIRDIMIERPVSVDVDLDGPEVAFLMDKYDFLALPVVDESNIMKGLITIDDVLAMVIDEAWGEKPGLL